MKKYLVLLAIVAFIVWGFHFFGYDRVSILMGLIIGYLLGVAFE